MLDNLIKLGQTDAQVLAGDVTQMMDRGSELRQHLLDDQLAGDVAEDFAVEHRPGAFALLGLLTGVADDDAVVGEERQELQDLEWEEACVSDISSASELDGGVVGGPPSCTDEPFSLSA